MQRSAPYRNPIPNHAVPNHTLHHNRCAKPPSRCAGSACPRPMIPHDPPCHAYPSSLSYPDLPHPALPTPPCPALYPAQVRKASKQMRRIGLPAIALHEAIGLEHEAWEEPGAASGGKSSRSI